MRSGETGFVCGGLSQFVQRTIQLLTDHESRRAMSAEARRYAFTRRWDAALEPLYRAYESVGSAEQPVRVSAPAVA
jgi:hypothetical protein